MTTDNTRSDACAMATSEAITLLETASRLGAALLTLTRHRRRVRRRALTRGLLHTTTRFWEPRWRARRQPWCEPTMGEHGEKTSSTCGGQHTGAVSGESQMQLHDTRYEGKSTCGGQHTERCGQRRIANATTRYTIRGQEYMRRAAHREVRSAADTTG